MPYLTAKNISLTYNLVDRKSIKSLLLGNNRDSLRSINALIDFNVSLTDGDRLAIIGNNGAGKTSLLKVLAGIYPPSSGIISHSGQVVPMLETATGFDMERSGWDNIRLRGLMIGLTPDKIEPLIQSIAEFSELGSHLDIPVKYYSTGMFVRLAFSVSTCINPDILILDEMLSAGDASFIHKAQHRVSTLMSNVKILVLVTHSMDNAVNFCNQCIWLDSGKVIAQGKPIEVTRDYLIAAKRA